MFLDISMSFMAVEDLGIIHSLSVSDWYVYKSVSWKDDWNWIEWQKEEWERERLRMEWKRIEETQECIQMYCVCEE